MQEQLPLPLETTRQKIDALRKAMELHHLDAYLIPSSDPHQSEYVAEHWQLRQWISGFTGSAGTVVVTTEQAGLWTDSRYFLQAEQQLNNSGIELFKSGMPNVPTHLEWLANELPSGSRVGFSGMLFSVEQVRQMKRKLEEQHIEVVTYVDLMGNLWKNRPKLPDTPVFELAESYAGQSRAQKLALVQEKLEEQEVDFHLVTALDDIAWLFNLRGSDVECNPVFYAYALVGKNEAYLFVDSAKVSDDIREAFLADSIFLKPYDSIEAFLNELTSSQSILIDKQTTNYRLYGALEKEQIFEGKAIIPALKAVKNKVEIQQLRIAMRKDGVALLRLFRWLEAQLDYRSVSEYEVAEKLARFRKAQGDYHGESFNAIVGYKSNGAIVHYRPLEDSCAQIYPEGILLLDSGGQYTQGTTDITRTVALSWPTEEQQRNFTLVLKGMIALSNIRFPEGTTGVQLDTLARQFLWQHHLNYGHGTGHGVGFFLNVHEPPQSFSPLPSGRGVTKFQPGMLTSNEPGFYKNGEYGIRIENLILCVEDKTGDFGKFLRFETLTLFPIDTHLIDPHLLSQEEKDWLNIYHRRVLKELSPLLQPEEVAWLQQKCAPI